MTKYGLFPGGPDDSPAPRRFEPRHTLHNYRNVWCTRNLSAWLFVGVGTKLWLLPVAAGVDSLAPGSAPRMTVYFQDPVAAFLGLCAGSQSGLLHV